MARKHQDHGEDEEERLLRELARDPSASAAVRMRSLEVLERKRARRAGEAAARETPDEHAADPMSDLDEVEAQRQKRSRRGSGARRVAER